MTADFNFGGDFIMSKFFNSFWSKPAKYADPADEMNAVMKSMKAAAPNTTDTIFGIIDDLRHGLGSEYVPTFKMTENFMGIRALDITLGKFADDQKTRAHLRFYPPRDDLFGKALLLMTCAGRKFRIEQNTLGQDSDAAGYLQEAVYAWSPQASDQGASHPTGSPQEEEMPQYKCTL